MIPNAGSSLIDGLFERNTSIENEVFSCLQSRLTQYFSASSDVERATARSSFKTDATGLFSKAYSDMRSTGSDVLREAYARGANAFRDEMNAIVSGMPQYILEQYAMEVEIPKVISGSGTYSDAVKRAVQYASEKSKRLFNEAARDVGLLGKGKTLQGDELQGTIDKVLTGYADKGIFGFTSTRSDGVSVNHQFDVYSRDLLTSSARETAIKGYVDESVNNGYHFVIISSGDSEPCDACEPYDDAVLSIDGTTHSDCTGTLAEAEGAGLFHYGCICSMNAYMFGDGHERERIGGATFEDEAFNEIAAERGALRAEENRLRRLERRLAAVASDAYKDKGNRLVASCKHTLQTLRADLTQKAKAASSKLSRVHNLQKDNLIKRVKSAIIEADKKRYATAVFGSQSYLTDHYNKHCIGEGLYDNITADEYVQKARDLLTAPVSSDVLRFVRTDGAVVKYRRSTCDMAIGTQNGNIVTLFRLNGGESRYYVKANK